METTTLENSSGLPTLRELQNDYLIIKKMASNFIVDQLKGDLLNSLKVLAGKENLIEIGHAYGDGDNGRGYYVCELILNLQNLEKKDAKDIIYLVVKYVPSPDNEYDWDVKKFTEITECNFVKALVLLSYMQVFARIETCRRELYRLSSREYSTCVKTVESGGLSFY